MMMILKGKIILVATILVTLITNASAQDQLRCVQITHIFPAGITEHGKLSSYDTSTVTYYNYGRIRIYQMPYLFKHLTIDNREDTIAIRTRYFIHDVDSVYGRLIDPTFRIFNLRAHIDTATVIRQFAELHLRESFATLNMEMVSSEKDSATGQLSEVYKVWQTGFTEKMTWHLRYSKEFDDVPFSLSPYIDSVKGLKLYSFTIENPPVQIPKKQITVDPYINSFIMRRGDCDNPPQVMELIRQYLNAQKSTTQ